MLTLQEVDTVRCSTQTAWLIDKEVVLSIIVSVPLILLSVPVTNVRSIYQRISVKRKCWHPFYCNNGLFRWRAIAKTIMLLCFVVELP